jgi:hypothetical protein
VIPRANQQGGRIRPGTDELDPVKPVEDRLLPAVVFALPSVLAILGVFLYGYASANPSTYIATAIQSNDLCRLIFRVIHFIATLLASFLNLIVFVPLVRGLFPILTVSMISLTPLLSLPAIEAESQKLLWNSACNRFDGTITLEAIGPLVYGCSRARFSDSMGGTEWQLCQSAPRVYQFFSDDSQVTFDLVKGTYMFHNWMKDEAFLTDPDQPLAFPGLGLFSKGDWIKPCESPSVNLKNSSGDVIVKSGRSEKRDIARMEVCAMEGMGRETIAIVAGRMLIALEDEVQRCCEQYDRHGKCLPLYDLFEVQ